MKKRLRAALILLMTSVFLLSVAACGSKKEAAGNVLRVGMECAYAPYNWTQSDDSNGAVPISNSNEYANGYDVMMAKKLAQSMGRELQIVKSDWDSLVPSVQSGTVDCVIAGQSMTPERALNVDFTEPYYYATIVTLCKTDSPYANAKTLQDLKGARCTSQLNTVWYDTCLPQIPDAQILTGQADAPAMLVALYSGSCDVVVTDQPTAKAALIAYPDFKLLDFEGRAQNFVVDESDIKIGISVKKGNDSLRKSLNDALSQMTREDFLKMMDEATQIQPLSK